MLSCAEKRWGDHRPWIWAGRFWVGSWVHKPTCIHKHWKCTLTSVSKAKRGVSHTQSLNQDTRVGYASGLKGRLLYTHRVRVHPGEVVGKERSVTYTYKVTSYTPSQGTHTWGVKQSKEYYRHRVWIWTGKLVGLSPLSMPETPTFQEGDSAILEGSPAHIILTGKPILYCCSWTGVFKESKYWDVFAEYAKNSPNDMLCRITVVNRGPDTATIHVLPQYWFRNTWIWGCDHEGCGMKPRMSQGRDGKIALTHESLGRLSGEGARSGFFNTWLQSAPRSHFDFKKR